MAQYFIKNKDTGDEDSIQLTDYIRKRTGKNPVELLGSGCNIPQTPSQDGIFSYQPNHGCIGSFFETWKTEDGSTFTASIGICQDKTQHNQSPDHYNAYLATFDASGNRIDYQADIDDSRKLKNHFIENKPPVELKKIDKIPQIILVNWQSPDKVILLPDNSSTSEIDLNSENQ